MEEKKIEDQKKQSRKDFLKDLRKSQDLMGEIVILLEDLSKERREVLSSSSGIIPYFYTLPDGRVLERTLKDDFLASPEKFEEFFTFCDLLLTKLKKEVSGFEIYHLIESVDPDLYEMMRGDSLYRFPHVNKMIIETLKRKAFKVGNKPLEVFANKKMTRYKTRFKETIDLLEILRKNAIKTKLEICILSEYINGIHIDFDFISKKEKQYGIKRYFEDFLEEWIQKKPMPLEDIKILLSIVSYITNSIRYADLIKEGEIIESNEYIKGGISTGKFQETYEELRKKYNLPESLENQELREK